MSRSTRRPAACCSSMTFGILGGVQTVDGESSDILRANVIFRAVALRPGHHTVSFTFHPFAGALAELQGEFRDAHCLPIKHTRLQPCASGKLSRRQQSLFEKVMCKLAWGPQSAHQCLIELALTWAMLGCLGLGLRVLKWQSALELLTTY